jgi:hypothetical protein
VPALVGEAMESIVSAVGRELGAEEIARVRESAAMIYGTFLDD